MCLGRHPACPAAGTAAARVLMLPLAAMDEVFLLLFSRLADSPWQQKVWAAFWKQGCCGHGVDGESVSTNPRVICEPEGWNPLRGHPGKRGLLGASEWPTFFPRSHENGHTSPSPLKSLPRGPESLSGALRGLWWEGVSETPNYWNEGSNSEAPKKPQNLWTPEPGFAPPVLPLGPQLKEYCLARGSWSTVGPLASALQEGLNRTLVYQINREEAPPGDNQKDLLEGKPTVQLNRTLGFPDLSLLTNLVTHAIAITNR